MQFPCVPLSVVQGSSEEHPFDATIIYLLFQACPQGFHIHSSGFHFSKIPVQWSTRGFGVLFTSALTLQCNSISISSWLLHTVSVIREVLGIHILY